MQPFDALTLFLIVTLCVLTLVAVSLVVAFRLGQKSQTLLVSSMNLLLTQQTNEVTSLRELNQSLMNQLRTTDPVSLAHLQALTTPATSPSDPYLPTGDDRYEAAMHEQMLRESGTLLDDEDLHGDLSDAGLI